MQLTVNGRRFRYDGPDEAPLLWVLRDSLGLTGTKFGCGAGLCGACTVHVDGRARRACMTPVASVAGRSIKTIEGLGAPDRLHAVQRAWIEEDVPQCGYCQAGQIMAAASLLASNPAPSDDDIERHSGLCRCGTYYRMRKAVHRAARYLRDEEQA